MKPHLMKAKADLTYEAAKADRHWSSGVCVAHIFHGANGI